MVIGIDQANKGDFKVYDALSSIWEWETNDGAARINVKTCNHWG